MKFSRQNRVVVCTLIVFISLVAALMGTSFAREAFEDETKHGLRHLLAKQTEKELVSVVRSKECAAKLLNSECDGLKKSITKGTSWTMFKGSRAKGSCKNASSAPLLTKKCKAHASFKKSGPGAFAWEMIDVKGSKNTYLLKSINNPKDCSAMYLAADTGCRSTAVSLVEVKTGEGGKKQMKIKALQWKAVVPKEEKKKSPSPSPPLPSSSPPPGDKGLCSPACVGGKECCSIPNANPAWGFCLDLQTTTENCGSCANNCRNVETGNQSVIQITMSCYEGECRGAVNVAIAKIGLASGPLAPGQVIVMADFANLGYPELTSTDVICVAENGDCSSTIQGEATDLPINFVGISYYATADINGLTPGASYKCMAKFTDPFGEVKCDDTKSIILQAGA